MCNIFRFRCCEIILGMLSFSWQLTFRISCSYLSAGCVEHTRLFESECFIIFSFLCIVYDLHGINSSRSKGNLYDYLWNQTVVELRGILSWNESFGQALRIVNTLWKKCRAINNFFGIATYKRYSVPETRLIRSFHISCGIFSIHCLYCKWK